MSMKTKKINGDLIATRNLFVGGAASVEGSLCVSHDVKVEGKIEARGFRGGDRGLYLTAEALERANPLPEPGWWALVGDTLPATLFVAQDGRWCNTGRSAGSVIIQVTNEDAELPVSVAIFSGEAVDVDLQEGSSNLTSESVGCRVAWAPDLGTFVLVVGENADGDPIAYRQWADRSAFTDSSGSPFGKCIYIDARTNRAYRFANSDLLPLA